MICVISLQQGYYKHYKNSGVIRYDLGTIWQWSQKKIVGNIKSRAIALDCKPYFGV